MELINSKSKSRRSSANMLPIEVLVGFLAVASAVIMVWAIISMSDSLPVMMVAGIVFTISIAILLWLLVDPDSVRARQTDAMLKLSSKMVDLMPSGLTMDAAQSICELLLPSTAAIAVAITDKEKILGYVGYREDKNPQGANIRTQATHDVIADGNPRVIYSAKEIGMPEGPNNIQAAIIIPLKVGKKKSDVRGTLKFYYRNPNKITETQKSIAQGFGELLSTQVAASEMEEQRELATSMELKMLQNQINPHFLFNTINTIASLIRTDPMKARTLLRDFAVFYRSTLENSQDLIELSRELEQTQRYFSFEVARFGEERLGMEVNTVVGDRDAAMLMVPPFLLQPLVENAVKHAMPAEGKLNVNIFARIEGDDIMVSVADDGVGMNEETRLNIMHPESQTGLGIAVKNVNDRMSGYFGPDAKMIVESEEGVGTTVTLLFPNTASQLEVEEDDDFDDDFLDDEDE